jgi:hypothetical protein
MTSLFHVPVATAEPNTAAPPPFAIPNMTVPGAEFDTHVLAKKLNVEASLK